MCGMTWRRATGVAFGGIAHEIERDYCLGVGNNRRPVWTAVNEGNDLAPGAAAVFFDSDGDLDLPLPAGNLS